MEIGRGQVGGIELRRVLTPGEKFGFGQLYTYTVYVERATKMKPGPFAEHVAVILSDRRGWIRGGKVAFQRVGKGAGTQVILATPATVDKLCAPLQTEGKVSCCNGARVVVNVDRWLYAVPHWTGTLKTYRQMLINHEMGHRIGHGHRMCPGDGKLAPVMQQQTYGLQGCRANSWPLPEEL